MILKDCVNYLLENGYGLVVSGQFVITKKLNDDLFNRTPNVITPEPPQVMIPGKPIVTKATLGKDLWNTFITDAEIPYRVTAPDGQTYTVRQYSPSIAKKLIGMINDPNIDYSILVASTKHYYKTITYKALLSNYIDKEIWLGEYQAWKENKGKHTANDGNNLFED